MVLVIQASTSTLPFQPGLILAASARSTTSRPSSTGEIFWIETPSGAFAQRQLHLAE